MREIKFRAWVTNSIFPEKNFMCYKPSIESISSSQTISLNYVLSKPELLHQWGAENLMQYTGLKDKNGLTEIYEYDVIDSDGNILGNKYENSDLLKEETNLTIEGFGTKDWIATYKEAVERGCKDS